MSFVSQVFNQIELFLKQSVQSHILLLFYVIQLMVINQFASIMKTVHRINYVIV